ncbi:MAG: 16S rRNA (cytidine(1402)-2'-O)-methyltransferase [Bacteroidales bacterium]|jgi:16S rRNA (cytidine1402-2'-O)-methyltransferase|nr:16S rRNA (cytidine(1402)-2'-O)-methyltransferase [Bacteroidales bacterium]
MPKLYLVPTPIGNLEDISLRALRILKNSALIFCEDTRVTAKLLKHYDISNPTLAYHQFNEHRQLSNFINIIKKHDSVAMVSDAGTPGISDPGFLLIRECIKENIDIECLPGSTAFVPALVNSGLPCDRFFFYGFLPHKKGRQTALQYLASLKETIILYESPFRLLKTLEQLSNCCGSQRKVCVSRELTKIYEENIRGSVAEAIAYFQQKTVKGEIIIIVEGNKNEV